MYKRSESDREVSEFNNAIGYLNHINSLFIRCSESQLGLNATSWFLHLNTLFLVLSSEMKEKEQKEFLDKQDKINNMIFKLQCNRNYQMKPFIPNDVYKELQMYEMKLRFIYKDSGLQNRKPDDILNSLK